MHATRQFCLLAGLASLLSLPAAAATPDPDSAALTSAAAASQLKETVERLNALDKWFTQAEKKRSNWLVELQRQDRDISQLNQQVDSIQEQVQLTDAELKILRDKQTTLNTHRAIQAELIADHVAAAYRLTGQDFLKQLLNQESPDTFARMIRYHRYFSESRLEVLSEYQDTLAELDTTNAALTAQQAQQTIQQKALQGEQHQLAGERTSRAQLIDELDVEKESKTADYERLEKDRTRLEQLLVELRRRATELDGTAFAAAKGSLPMPTSGRIRHAFGATRADGRLRWHGIDIASPHGTPVTAVYRGRVIFADWLRGFGLLTILDHGSDYMTLYGHADVLYKNVGDWVESGEAIAGAGNSGGTKNSGIYFEVRHKGEPKDPISWVVR